MDIDERPKKPSTLRVLFFKKKAGRAASRDYKESETNDAPEVEQLNTEIQVVEPDKHDDDRDQWGSQVQFVLSLIAYSVGLGNIWRFPYLCQQHGGGAFLIPYTIMLFLEGIPIFYLEVGIGQKIRKGPIGVWHSISPYLGGVGIGCAVVSFVVGLYYNVIITWCLFYFGNSLRAKLPWSEYPKINGTVVEECELSDSTTYFWYRNALNAAPDIEETGKLNWQMTLCLLFAWVITYLCLCRGIKSSGKVIYFTALFPYVVLVIYFIRGVMLPGAGAGLRYMFTPRIERLKDPQVWLDAATQIFFSFGVAFGGLVAYASYNKRDNDCRRDTILTSITNFSTSIFSCIVIFCILGFKAHTNYERCMQRNGIELARFLGTGNDTFNETYIQTFMEPCVNVTSSNNKERFINFTEVGPTGARLECCSVEENLKKSGQGTGLAFIVFTQAMLEFPIPPFWSVIFFMMLLTLGVGSQIGTVQGVISSLFDLRVVTFRKEVVCGVVSLLSFLVGLLFVTQAGEYWVKVFDSYGGSFSLMMIAFFEVIAVWFFYGFDRFGDDLKEMTGHRPGWYFKITWRLAPILMFVMFIGSIASKIMTADTYGAWDADLAEVIDKPYPVHVRVVGALLIVLAAIWVPVVAIFHLIHPKYVKVPSKGLRGAGGTTTTMVGEDRDSGHNSDEVDNLSNDIGLDYEDNPQSETASTVPVLELKA